MTSPVVQIVNSVQLAGSSGLLYQSPIGTWTQIMALTATNVDTAVHTVTFNIVPNGASATTANITTPARAVGPGSSYSGQNEYGQVLNPGDALYGFADTAATVNVFVSGLQTSS